MRKQLESLAVAAVCLALGACNEAVPSGGAAAPPSTTPPDVPPDITPGCAQISPGPSPLRRLTRFEYNNTVHDLFGDTTAPANRFPPEEQALGFDNDTTVLRVPTLLAESYLTGAEALAGQALANAAAFIGCDQAALVDSAAEQACATAFIARFGQRAYRRPLSTEQQSRLLGVFRATRSELDFNEAMAAVIQTVLLSPQFMYRVEQGAPVPNLPDVEAVDPWAVASRLSYFLWGSMPDDVLFDAAQTQSLTTRQQIRAQAERMFDDQRTRAMVRHFHDYWLGLLNIDGQGKDPNVFPDYTGQTGPLLRRQTEAFAEYVYFDGHGDLTMLLTAPFNMLNEPLARYFGVTGPVGDAFVKVDLDPKRQAGLLTQGSILSWNATANRTHPILRGKFIREKLLCNPPPDPPDNITDMRDSVENPNATERERLAVHRADPACAGCHTLMDPIGFGLENFDASGRYRDTESSLPVDASGEINGTDVPGPFVGPIELSAKLAASQQVESCLVTHWARFANGRAETAADACGVSNLLMQFRSSGRSLRELLLSMTQTDAFLYRTSPQAVLEASP